MKYVATKKHQKAELATKGLKKCPRCAEPKVLSEFGKDKNQKGELKCLCKDHIKEDYENNKEEINKKAKEFRDKPVNKEKINKQRKEYRDKPENKKKAAIYKKEWAKKNREKLAKQKKAYHIENAEKINSRSKKWAKNNKLKRNETSKKKYQNDIDFKIIINLRTRLTKALKHNFKSKRTLELLGCSVEELKIHLQSQFTKGMSWDNHTLHGWHIDHIKPCAKFDLTDPKQQELCFNFTNLQPLWMEDNLKKGNKY